MSRSGRHTRIYVGNLPEDVREREIEDLFYKYGRIRDIDLKTGRTSNHTAFAFVEFDSPAAAEDAIVGRDGRAFGDLKLRVEFSGERGARRQGFRGGGPPKRTDFRVVVTGLSPSASWQDLKDHMRKAGPVGYADSRDGRGVVEYENEDDMRYACERLDKSEFKNPFGRSVIRVRAESDTLPLRSRSRSHSRSRSGSRSSRRSRSRSRSPIKHLDDSTRRRRRSSRSRGRDTSRSHSEHSRRDSPSRKSEDRSSIGRLSTSPRTDERSEGRRSEERRSAGRRSPTPQRIDDMNKPSD